MIAIVDYGLGNVQAFKNVYERFHIPVTLVKSEKDFSKAEKLILPGVGSFDYAMDKLNKSGMRNTLEELVLEENMPILGVCVGMQMLAKFSEEGDLPGLNFIDAEVKKFNLRQGGILPHMGWNNVNPRNYNGLFRGMQEEARFYFLHSFYFQAYEESEIEAIANYEEDYTCAIRKNNIFGVQFHPEKSHSFGAKLLTNFANI